jgi:transcription elongation factor GreA
MTIKPMILTAEGLRKLEEELEVLKTVRRKEVAEKIKEARAFGDISENSEYDEAKNEQAELETRINKLDTIVRGAVVVDESEIDTDHVSIGTKVKVFDFDFDEEVDYVIVGATEADPFQNKISNDSPIGAALIGKAVGEQVEISVPDGSLKMKVLEISR